MFTPYKRNNETLESCIEEDGKKAKRVTFTVTMMLIMLGLAVCGWLVFDRLLESVEAKSAGIMGLASLLSFYIMTVPGSSQRSCENCWLKKLFVRKNQTLNSKNGTS